MGSSVVPDVIVPYVIREVGTTEPEGGGVGLDDIIIDVLFVTTTVVVPVAMS